MYTVTINVPSRPIVILRHYAGETLTHDIEIGLDFGTI